MMRVGESFCPGILHAVQAKDGLLTRIRVPGGMITPSQLAAVAELSASFADGHIEITSRSNLQLRAIQKKDLNPLIQGLGSAGFLPSREHDRVRNIVTSPFAGLGFGEVLDTRVFVRELDRRLIADRAMAGLPPKFSFSIDGGGDWFARDSDDLTLRIMDLDRRHSFHFVVGDALSGLCVRIDKALDCVLEAAKICLKISEEFHIPARGRKIASIPQAMDRLLEGLSSFLTACPSPTSSPRIAHMPMGVYPTHRSDLASVVPLVPLGRLTAEQMQRIALIAKECDGDIRFAPWRGIVLGALPERSIIQVTERLGAVGLSLDNKDGYRGIAACAGSSGCDAALADVRRDASLLARRVEGRNTERGWTVNISGCEKQCAMRNGATAELIASPSGYDLRINGQLIASNCSLESAMDKMAACQAEGRSEVHS